MIRHPLVFLIFACTVVYSAPVRKPEAQIKAATAVNLATFTTYPKARRPRKDGTLRLGVIGKHAIADALLAFHGKKQGTRKLDVRRFTKAENARSCHVLFIAPCKEAELAKILKALGKAPVLVVGEQNKFAHAGGMVGFRIEKKKVRFDFNRLAMQQAGLKLHPKLLRLGRIVKEREK